MKSLTHHLAQLYTPLSESLIPLLHGTVRRRLMRRGMQMEQHTLAGIGTNLYRFPARNAAADGMPVLLLHGIADNALTWSDVIEPLASIGPVFALDLPGFGLSSYPRGRRYTTFDELVSVTHALIADVIGQPPLVVGNSLGGWAVLRLALTTPEAVRGVVLLNPGGALLGGRPSWDAFITTVGVPDLRTVRTIYRQMFGRTPAGLYLGQHSFRALFLRDAVQQFVAVASEDDFFLPEDLQHLQVPTGLVWGTADTFLPAGSFEFFRDNLPDPDVLLLPRCGHLPQQERPRQLVRFVRHFAETAIGDAIMQKHS